MKNLIPFLLLFLSLLSYGQKETKSTAEEIALYHNTFLELYHNSDYAKTKEKKSVIQVYEELTELIVQHHPEFEGQISEELYAIIKNMDAKVKDMPSLEKYLTNELNTLLPKHDVSENVVNLIVNFTSNDERKIEEKLLYLDELLGTEISANDRFPLEVYRAVLYNTNDYWNNYYNQNGIKINHLTPYDKTKLADAAGGVAGAVLCPIPGLCSSIIAAISSSLAHHYQQGY